MPDTETATPRRIPTSGPEYDEARAEVRRAMNQQLLGVMDLIADRQNDLRRGFEVSVQHLQSIHDAVARIAGLDPQPGRVPETLPAGAERR